MREKLLKYDKRENCARSSLRADHVSGFAEKLVFVFKTFTIRQFISLTEVVPVTIVITALH